MDMDIHCEEEREARRSNAIVFSFFWRWLLSSSLIILMSVVLWSQKEKWSTQENWAMKRKACFLSFVWRAAKSPLTAVDGFLINCGLLMWKDGDIRFFSTLIAQFLFKRFALFLLPQTDRQALSTLFLVSDFIPFHSILSEAEGKSLIILFDTD